MVTRWTSSESRRSAQGQPASSGMAGTSTQTDTVEPNGRPDDESRPRGAKQSVSILHEGSEETGTCGEGLVLFLKFGPYTRRRAWNGKTWHDLVELFQQTFSLPPAMLLLEDDFSLRHRVYGVEYSNFSLSDLYPHAVVELREPRSWAAANGGESHTEQLRRDAAAVDVPRAKGDPPGSLGGAGSGEEAAGLDDDDKIAQDPEGFLRSMRERARTAMNAGIQARIRDRRPKWLQKVWQFLDDPSSSLGAQLWMVFMISVIVYSTITFMVSTLPYYNKEMVDSPFGRWFAMEAVAIAVFTFEIALRLASCKSILQYFFPLVPGADPSQQTRSVNLMNWVDIVSVVPFYVELGFQRKSSVPGLQVLRVLRLVRVFRLFRVSRSSIEVFRRTMAASSHPMSMLLFFVAMGVVIFASLEYYCERGTYDTALKIWKRPVGFHCLFDAEETASGVAINDAWIANNAPTCVVSQQISTTHAVLDCLVEYRHVPSRSQSDCLTVYQVSPFASIPESFWFTIVALMAVGYGDVYPVLWYGKLMASLVMIFGVLIIALPISVIGTTFAREYQDMVLQRKFQGLNAATRDKVLEDAKQMAEYEQDVDDEGQAARKARIKLLADAKAASGGVPGARPES